MSDEQVREAERRWKLSGALEDRAALVRERLRAGAVSLVHVELAAHLRDEAAALVAGFPERGASPSDPDLSLPGEVIDHLRPFADWAQVIERDLHAAVRTAIAVLRQTKVDFTDGVAPPRRIRRQQMRHTRRRTGLSVVPLPPVALHGQPEPIGASQARRDNMELVQAVVQARRDNMELVQAVVQAAEDLARDWTDANRIRVISATSQAAVWVQLVGAGGESWVAALGRGLLDSPARGWLVEVCYGAVTHHLFSVGQDDVCAEHPKPQHPQQVFFQQAEPCWNCLIERVRAAQAATSNELVPWLLGDDDPLAAKPAKVKPCS